MDSHNFAPLVAELTPKNYLRCLKLTVRVIKTVIKVSWTFFQVTLSCGLVWSQAHISTMFWSWIVTCSYQCLHSFTTASASVAHTMSNPVTPASMNYTTIIFLWSCGVHIDCRIILFRSKQTAHALYIDCVCVLQCRQVLYVQVYIG